MLIGALLLLTSLCCGLALRARAINTVEKKKRIKMAQERKKLIENLQRLKDKRDRRLRTVRKQKKFDKS